MDVYVRAMHKMRMNCRVLARAMSLMKYVCEAVRKCKAFLEANYSGRCKLPKRAENLFAMGYDPKMDVSP